MKEIVRHRFMTIPGKLTGDIRITIDDRAAEYSSDFDGGHSTNISLYPMIGLTIKRSPEIDSSGNKVKAPWNPNDNIAMTKFTFPMLVNEVKGINEDMKIPDLYVYRGDRLELNEKKAEEVRRVFMIGNTTIELAAVIIVLPDTERQVEGIQMKFNNDQSTVLLTVTELESFTYNLEHLDVDTITFMMYLNYCKPSVKEAPKKGPVVDIIPPKKPEPVKNESGLLNIDPREFVE